MAVCPQCNSTSDSLGVPCSQCERACMVRPHALAEEDPLVGRMVGGRFALIDVVGTGAVGVVYEAVQHPVGRRCAVKVLRDDLVSEESMQQRFLREATAASRLNHPNVVALYDFGVEDDGLSYIAMEYVEGETLLPYMDTLNIDATVHVLRQILRALAEAHDQGIVHRDLKPDNVVMCSVGSDAHFAKVLDFGLAKLEQHEDEATISAVGEVFGTPLYMSPEQVVGSDKITTAADIYAFGAMAFELITGNPPYHGRNAMIIMQKHLNEPIPTMHPRQGLELLQRLKPVIDRCLAKKPEQRFSDARTTLLKVDECLGLQSGPGVKAPTVGERAVYDSESDLVVKSFGPHDSKQNSPVATWLHAPPEGAPKWDIPRKSGRAALDKPAAKLDPTKADKS